MTLVFVGIPQLVVQRQRSLTRYPVQPLSFISPSPDSRRAVVSCWQKYAHFVLANRLGGVSLPRNSVFRETDRPDITIAVYHGYKVTKQQQQVVVISMWE